MDTAELRRSIAVDLSLLGESSLRKVMDFVKQLTIKEKQPEKDFGITAGVSRLVMGVDLPGDTDWEGQLEEYIKEKYL